MCVSRQIVGLDFTSQKNIYINMFILGSRGKGAMSRYFPSF